MTLSEKESKELLGGYGLPFPQEEAVFAAAEAAGAAERLGFPVALKGFGAKLSHKSELGLVELGLASAREVREAAEGMERSAAGFLEGFLVAPMVEGDRQFMAGLVRDKHFGPVVLFGLGGVFAEKLDDAAMALAPLDAHDVEGLLTDSGAAKLLGPARGREGADLNALGEILTGLSRLAEEHPEVSEVDLNPIIVGGDGRVTCVDALVAKEEAEAVETAPPIDPPRIYALFHPRSIAFVGASADFGKWGNALPANTVAGGYDGEIHLVNPKGGEIAGRRVYKSVREIEAEVDLAVVTVPSRYVNAVVGELGEKGVKSAIVITSGYSETDDEGLSAEAELVEAAVAADVLFLGPNTMGIANPHAKLYLNPAVTHPEPGGATLISQSGNMGVQLLEYAQLQGIGIRAFAGIGNEALMTMEDFIEAMGLDEKTRTVVLYVESVNDGRRFFESSKRLAGKKPVILLKGGRTDAGSKAASSHTGAMASDVRVFNAACEQAGIIMAEQPSELLDLSAAFSSLPLPAGDRVAIMTLGGGWGVVTTDLCAERGLTVEPLPGDIVESFDKLLPEYWSRSNPVDLVGEGDMELPLKVLEGLARSDAFDAVLMLGLVGRSNYVEKMGGAARMYSPGLPAGFTERISAAYHDGEERLLALSGRLMEDTGKPILGVSLVGDGSGKTVIDIPGYEYKGIYFSSPDNAVKCLAAMSAYAGKLRKKNL